MPRSQNFAGSKGSHTEFLHENLLRQSSQIFAIDAIGIEQGARNMVRGRFGQESQNLIRGVIRRWHRARSQEYYSMVRGRLRQEAQNLIRGVISAVIRAWS